MIHDIKMLWEMMFIDTDWNIIGKIVFGIPIYIVCLAYMLLIMISYGIIWCCYTTYCKFFIKRGKNAGTYTHK